MRLLMCAVITLCLIACQGEKKSKYPKLDLMKYGFPIEITAPADAVIEKGDLGVMSDVTVKSGDGFYVQIFGSDAITMDATKVKTDLINDTKASRYFSKIVEEYENGFIFEKKIDERVNYDFRFVKIQGDKEYIYQTALIGTYTEEQVRTMYNAVQ